MKTHKLFRLIIVIYFAFSIIGQPMPAMAQDPPPNPDPTIVEYTLPRGGLQPSGLTVAPNGDVWFAEWTGGAIGRLKTDGTITEYRTLQGANTLDATVGADGNIWFTETLYGEPPGGNIGRITPDGSFITEFPIPTQAQFSPHNITLGPDGNLWFTEAGSSQIGRVTPNGTFTEFPVQAGGPHGITTGPDGNIWFTGYDSGSVGKITLDGHFTGYAVGSPGPFEIVTGPDGNIWFTEYWGPNVNRMTPDGIVTQFPISSGVGTRGITAGKDGNIWFTEPQNNKIGRITPDGVMTEYPIPTANSWPCYITSGPDGTLWFSELFGGKIGRINLNLPSPVLTVPEDITAEATSASGAVVTFSATATDAVDPAPVVTCSPASGSLFALGGPHTVTCTAKNAFNISTSGSFNVTVVDTTAPSITCPANVSGTAGQTIDLGTPTVSDIVDSNPSVSNNAPPNFPPGVTTVTWTATDHSSNSSSCPQTVTLTYRFDGFYQPVDNLPVVNTVKGGSTVPVKWNLFDFMGNKITDIAAVLFGWPKIQQLNCTSFGNLAEDVIETTATGSTVLRYDFSAMQFIYNWQTPKLPNTCWRLDVKFIDGTTKSANFKLK